MAFTPFARFRYFTLDNMKALLDVYPDMAEKLSWSEAGDIIEAKKPGYKQTAYQQACQLGLENRGNSRFQIQSYLYTFEDEKIIEYLKFWVKTYFAPNPYVKSNDSPILIYCEMAKEILLSFDLDIEYEDFFKRRIGGGSKDVLLNAIKTYAEPIKYKKIGDQPHFYINPEDKELLEQEIARIESDFAIPENNGKAEFFDRYSFSNFCKFYGIDKYNKEPIRFHTAYNSKEPRNWIVFGAPGTGKSFEINEKRKELLGDCRDADYERVTFHPDYTYAHFVGTYKPVPCKDSEDKDAITYEYVPGPFMRVLVKALQNGRTDNVKPFLLIIEEINRANVAAVFGDVFQLLDRDANNVSEYPIQASKDIREYLADKLGGQPDDYSQICIPDNMFIWATMNSADQGVFPMDTAFKRRWDFTYIGIDEKDTDIRGKYVWLAKGTQKVEWNELRKAINRFLADLKINEDKQLGPYFISRSIVVPKEKDEIDRESFINVFKNKVIMYLFEDAAKQKRPTLFEGCSQSGLRYSEICKAFDEKGIDIFNQGITSAAKSDN